MKAFVRLVSIFAMITSILSCEGWETPSRLGTPTWSERTRVLADQSSIIFWRIAGTSSGVELPGHKRMGIWPGVILFRGDFESGGALSSYARPKHLDRESLRAGWTYAVVEPGTQYLAFDYPGSALQQSLDGLRRFRMEISEPGKVIYVGTVNIEAASDTNDAGPAKRLGSFEQSSIEITDESELAQTIYAEYFAGVAEYDVSLMRGHAGPIILRTYEP